MFLGATAVLVAAHQSRGGAGFLAILVPLAVLEPVLIVSFHDSLLQVVQVMDISMGLGAVGLAAWYVIQERSEQIAVEVSPLTASVQAVPQLQVNR